MAIPLHGPEDFTVFQQDSARAVSVCTNHMGVRDEAGQGGRSEREEGVICTNGK